MDKIAEKVAELFGLGPFILFHAAWFAGWLVGNAFLKFDNDLSLLTLVVSLEAIFLSLFILRAENIQSARQEKILRQDIKHTKQDLELTRSIHRKIAKKSK